MQIALKALAVAVAGVGVFFVYGCGGASPVSDLVATSEVASLPAKLLAQTPSSNCAAFRSGRYNQILFVNDSVGIAEKTGKFSVDAAAGTWSDRVSTGTFSSAGEACHFTSSSGADYVVSPAGVIVMRFGSSPKYLGVALPEQTFTLADMAGEWNVLGMGSETLGIFEGIANSFSLNTSGTIIASIRCRNAATWDLTSCTSNTTLQPSLRVNGDGGFDVMDSSDVVIGRMFAYKAGNGDVMSVNVNNNGTFQISTRQRTNSLPAVGSVMTVWSLAMNSLLTSSSVAAAFSSAIVSSNSNHWNRLQKTVGGSDEHLETLSANYPRDGYTLRPAGAAYAADGISLVPYSEYTALDLRGMGMSAMLYPAQKLFAFSVVQP